MTDPSVGSSSPNWASLISNEIMPTYVEEGPPSTEEAPTSTGPSPEATRDVPLLMSSLSGQMSPYAPVFHPMGSYASHLLALEQAVQVNPQSLPPPPPRPMDPNAEEYYDRGQLQDVYNYNNPHEVQAHMYPDDYGEAGNMNGCTGDLSIRVAPNSPYPADNQRAHGNWHDPSNREYWPDGDQQNGQVPVQRLMYPQMHMQMPPYMQGQMPPHMQGQMPPYMQGQISPYMQGQMPPHMQGQMPHYMQGQMPHYMQGQMPPHMQGQMPPYMQGQMPPHMSVQVPVQMPVQIPPQMLIQIQQAPQGYEYWRDMEQREQMPYHQYGPDMEQQMSPMLSQCQLEAQTEAEGHEYFREYEQANPAAMGQLYDQHPQYPREYWHAKEQPMPDAPLHVQIPPQHLHYWRDMEQQQNAQYIQNQGVPIPGDYWRNGDHQCNENEEHAMLPPPGYWHAADQMAATVAPHQEDQYEDQHQLQLQHQDEHQNQTQKQSQDQFSKISLQHIQELSREIWNDMDLNDDVAPPHSGAPPQPTSYDYWRDIEQMIASYGLQSQQAQNQGAAASNTWQDVEDHNVAEECYLEEADQQLAENSQQFGHGQAPLWWSSDGQHDRPQSPYPGNWMTEQHADLEDIEEEILEHQARAERGWWSSEQAMQQEQEEQHQHIDWCPENEHPTNAHVHTVPTGCEYWNQGSASLASQAEASMQTEPLVPPNDWWVDSAEHKTSQIESSCVPMSLDKEQQTYTEEEQKQNQQQQQQLLQQQQHQHQKQLQQELQQQKQELEEEQEQQQQEQEEDQEEEQEEQEEQQLPQASTTPREWWQAAAFTPQEHMRSRNVDPVVEWVPYSYADLNVLQTKSEEKVDTALSTEEQKAEGASTAPTSGNNNANTNVDESEEEDFPSFEEFARQVSECSLSSSEYIATLRNLMIRAHNLMLPLLRGRFANMTQVQMAAYTTAILEVTPLHPSLFVPSTMARPWMGTGGLLPPCHPHSLTPEDLARINPRPILVSVATQTEYLCWCMHMSMFPPPPLPSPSPMVRPQGPHFGTQNGPRMLAPCGTAPLSFWGRPLVPMHPHPYPHAHQMPRPHGSRYGYRVNTYSMPCRFNAAGNGRSRHMNNMYNSGMHNYQSEDNASPNQFMDQPPPQLHHQQGQQQQEQEQELESVEIESTPIQQEHLSRRCSNNISSSSQSSSLTPRSSSHCSSVISNNDSDADAKDVAEKCNDNAEDNINNVVEAVSMGINSNESAINQNSANAEESEHIIESDVASTVSQDGEKEKETQTPSRAVKPISNLFLHPTGPVMPSMPMMHFLMSQNEGQDDVPPLIFDMNDSSSPTPTYAQFLPNINMNINMFNNVMAHSMTNPMANPTANYMGNPMNNPTANPMGNHMTNPMNNAMANPMGNPMANYMGNPMGHPMANFHIMPPEMAAAYYQMGPEMGMVHTAMILPYVPYKNPNDPYSPMDMHDAMQMNMHMNMGMNENYNGANASFIGIPFDEINPMVNPNVYMTNDMLLTPGNNDNMMNECHGHNEIYNAADHRKENNIHHDAGECESINKLATAAGQSELN